MNGNYFKLTPLVPFEQSTLQALDNVFTDGKNNKAMMGWVNLPWSEDALKDSKKFVSKIKKNQTTLCVCGIGGSSLGAKAIYDFLNPKKKIEFLANVDGYEFNRRLKKIDFKKTHFLFISKSGETTETLIQLASIIQELKKYKLNAQNHISVITEDNQGKLRKIARALNLNWLNVPENVGGRFSVFSQVGLAPLLWAGIDIKKLFSGAKSVVQQKELIASFCDFYLKTFEKAKTISVFWFYCDALYTFGLWLEQLWSESLAKAGGPTVSTPLICIGSNDQHSLLQQFNEGQKDKSFLFFRNLESEKSEKIKKQNISELKLFEQKSVGEMLSVLARATEQALKNKNYPVLEMIVQDHSPQTIGAMIYFFELAVATLGEKLSINAYNQPGVEEAKRIALGTLGDARYLDLALK